VNDARRDPLGWIEARLERLERDGLRRQLRAVKPASPGCFELGGRELANFGSNDYLGLAADSRVVEAACAATGEFGWGSGASPLVCGRTTQHAELERRLAEFEACEAALLFPAGFAANAGTIPALVERGDFIFSDQKNHASIVDGCRLSRAEVKIYRHGDVEHLRELLKSSQESRRKLIVSDGLFSMDGDLAPLPDIAALAEEHGAMLMVDEAHATGVFGKRGRGAAEHLGVEDAVDVRVGTLSKAAGSLGGFVAGRRALIDWLANRARSYVFSTAPPAALCAAALAALEIIQDEPERRSVLLQRAGELREALRSQGWNTAASVSQIIPVVVGDPQRAMQLSADLSERGFFVPGIRPPSVPPEESLLRISLSCIHEPETIDRLLRALDELKEPL